MSYIAESLHDMSDADLRAWALGQVGPGPIHDRIAEAEALISWVLAQEAVPQEGQPNRAGSCSALESLRGSFGSRHQSQVKTSGSSSGGSDGESAGELPTPSRTETAPDREGGQ